MERTNTFPEDSTWGTSAEAATKISFIRSLRTRIFQGGSTCYGRNKFVKLAAATLRCSEC